MLMNVNQGCSKETPNDLNNNNNNNHNHNHNNRERPWTYSMHQLPISLMALNERISLNAGEAIE